MSGGDKGVVDLQWCIALPKLELHAHLGGSIRHSTLLELARSQGKVSSKRFAEYEEIINKKNASLTEGFKLFDLIRDLTANHAVVTRITREMVEDFAAENTIYLEIRTTPKNNAAAGMTKRSYMEAVLKGLKSVESVEVSSTQDKDTREFTSSRYKNGVCKHKRHIYVRLLLSIDRRETSEAAMETVLLALELKKFGIVGVDLSGNPTVGHWQTFVPALSFAKENGLCVTLHCGEVPNPSEIEFMLDFRPQRIGHACCLENPQLRKLKSSNIPVEICLTSNLRSNAVSSLSVHPFAEYHKSGHPVAISTDDKGILSTSLSYEYFIAASTFGLKKRDLTFLAGHAIEFAFVDQPLKSSIRDAFLSASTVLHKQKSRGIFGYFTHMVNKLAQRS